MADEIKKDDGVEEEVEQEETISEEVLKSNTDFDAKVADAADATLATEEPKKDEDDGDEKNAADEKAAAEKVEADKVAKAADEKNASEAEKDPISTSLIIRAAKAGLSEADIQQYAKGTELDNAVSVAEQSQKESKTIEKTDTEKAAEAEAGKFDVKKLFAEVKLADGSNVDINDYDEGMLKVLDKIGESVTGLTSKITEQNTVIENLKAENGTMIANASAKANDDYTEWFDSKIADLGETFEDVLGKGNINEVKTNADAIKARGAIDEQMGVLAAGYKANKKPLPTSDVLFDMAVKTLHTEKYIQQAAKINKGNKRADQAIGPGSKKAAVVTDTDTARKGNSDFDKKIAESV